MKTNSIDLQDYLGSDTERSIPEGCNNERSIIAHAIFHAVENINIDLLDEHFDGNVDWCRGYQKALLDVGLILESMNIKKPPRFNELLTK